MTTNEFYKIIKSWLGSNAVTSENSDRKFHLHRIEVVQNNLVLNKGNTNFAMTAVVKSDTLPLTNLSIHYA